MILDSQTRLSGVIAADGTVTAQAITATAISQNVVDLRQPSGSPAVVDEGIVGGGVDVFLNVIVRQAFNTLTSLTITLESDSAAGLATAPVVHFSSGAIALAALTANTQVVRIPIPSTDYKRYLGLRYTVTGTNPTQGSLEAFLSFGTQRSLNYPTAFTVDA